MDKTIKNICLIAGLCLAKPGYGQYTLGNTGLLNTPSAQMAETGTCMVGGNFLPEKLHPFGGNTGNYFATVTLLPFLELTYRQTLMRINYPDESHRVWQQDRSTAVRIRPLKEGKYHPAIVIGGNDLVGTEFYKSVYAVATKGITWGGGHRVECTLGYIYGMQREVALQHGVVAGVSYQPAWWPEMKVIAEYDSKRVNMGLTARLWKRLSLHAFTAGFDCIAGGIRYECVLLH